ARGEPALEVVRDAGVAHLGEPLDLREVGYGDDPRDDWDVDSRRARLAHEVEVELVVEEELGDQEARPGLDLLLREVEVVVEVGRLGVHLGKACATDAEVVAVRDQLDQLDRGAEAVWVRAPLAL